MASKRAKIQLEAASEKKESDRAPTALISECFDLLLQAPRKQQIRLLSGLLKTCSEAQLAAMRAEAVKLGLVVESKSVFQKCSHDILDSCFGFLDMKSLRAAETVCSRWRSACVDSGAGWGTVLSRRAEIDSEFMSDYYRHRLTLNVSSVVSQMLNPFHAALSTCRVYAECKS